jgi:hypothetical protein
LDVLIVGYGISLGCASGRERNRIGGRQGKNRLCWSFGEGKGKLDRRSDLHRLSSSIMYGAGES